MNTGMNSYRLLKNFPEFAKPSYEIMTHKKVSDEYDLEVAIPYGKKCFLWFTMFESNPLCCIIECGRNTKLQDNIHILPFPPVNNLFLGTLLSGYLIEYEDNPEIKYFLADDVYCLNGHEFCNPVPLTDKICAFLEFFSRLPNGKIYGNYNIHSIVMNRRDVNKDWRETVAYPVKFIQYRSSSSILPNLNWSPSKNGFTKDDEQTVKTDHVWSQTNINVPDWNLNLKNNQLYNSKQLFWITADLRYDIYFLYVQKDVLYEHAFVPDMETSIMMNKIFRIIPENSCLDRVEESEDEADFENIQANKYMLTKKKVLMECVFNWKFKRWIPLGRKTENLAKFVPNIDNLIHTPKTGSCKKIYLNNI